MFQFNHLTVPQIKHVISNSAILTDKFVMFSIVANLLHLKTVKPDYCIDYILGGDRGRDYPYWSV